ncbi:response regulator transcription factor [Chitinophaga sp. LS1]|uniref:response regulator transcription factor n=1 Tax=Chitinophaga sp. LS1 TaxID=3051176 RepID=UPI002AAA950B|nr:response regulator transcription factor [Chitinophaga sp. LS1]WPV63807.1 response regulator transcription factor [Chitinophaga sp. LS1]
MPNTYITTNRIYQIGIIDEDPQFSDDLMRYILKDKQFSSCLHSANLRNAMQLLYNTSSLNPDLLLLDICLTEIQKEDTIKTLKQIKPEMLIVILTKDENKHLIKAAFDRGADGYLQKSENFSSIYHKIVNMLLYGQPVVSQHIFRYMVFRNDLPQPAVKEKLTKKEKEVAQMVLEGLSHKEIAARLHLSLNTIQYHMKNIYFKLDIKTKTELFKMHFHKI